MWLRCFARRGKAREEGHVCVAGREVAVCLHVNVRVGYVSGLVVE
jgi:hypothetical protein